MRHRTAIALVALTSLAAAQQAGSGPRRVRPTVALDQLERQTPPGVKLLPDLAYREGHPAWKLDLALPARAEHTRSPAVIMIHGGGWANGDKRLGMFAGLMLDYARHGYVSASINYRLSGDAPLPAAIEDAKNAVRWLRAHAAAYGIDPARIGAFGNSAGAHLAAMLALAGPGAGLEGDGTHLDQSSAIQAACAVAAPTDLERMAHLVQPQRARTLFGDPPGDAAARARRASPITYVHAGAPPILLIHGTSDATVPHAQSEILHKALQAAGARKFTLMSFAGAGHDVFTRNSPVSAAAVKAFFDSVLAVP